MKTVQIDVARNADMAQVRQQCCDLLTGIYDVRRHPHSILVDEGKEQEALNRLSQHGVLSSVRQEKHQ